MVYCLDLLGPELAGFFPLGFALLMVFGLAPSSQNYTSLGPALCLGIIGGWVRDFLSVGEAKPVIILNCGISCPWLLT